MTKRHLARLLRRTARKLIAWSNRLDAPIADDAEDAEMWRAVQGAYQRMGVPGIRVGQ